MKKVQLLAQLDVLNQEKKEIEIQLERINALELVIEQRITSGLKPVIDEKTNALLSKENIKHRIVELADELIREESIHYPVLIGVMNGALPFVTELRTQLSDRGYLYQYDALQASSYRGVVSGALVINNILKIPLGARDVVVVDDVCDTGKTSRKIMELLFKQGAKSVKLMVLVNKAQVREEHLAIEPNFTGFTVSKDAFIVGWGLDYEQLLRNFDAAIGAVDVATLPKDEEKELFESKTELNSRLRACMSSIDEVTEQLSQYNAEACPASPGSSRSTLFANRATTVTAPSSTELASQAII